MLRGILLAVALVASSLFAADAASPENSHSPRQPAAQTQPHTTQPAEQILEQLRKENQDLNAELDDLQAKLYELRSRQPEIRHFQKMRVGMTRAELFDFLQIHHNNVRVLHDDVVSTNMERVLINYWGMGWVTKWVVQPRMINGEPNPVWEHAAKRAERREYQVLQGGSAVIALENGKVVTIVIN